MILGRPQSIGFGTERIKRDRPSRRCFPSPDWCPWFHTALVNRNRKHGPPVRNPDRRPLGAARCCWSSGLLYIDQHLGRVSLPVPCSGDPPGRTFWYDDRPRRGTTQQCVGLLSIFVANQTKTMLHTFTPLCPSHFLFHPSHNKAALGL